MIVNNKIQAESLAYDKISTKEALKAQIDRFKTADVEREVLKLAKMASDITFVQQLIKKVDELMQKVQELEKEKEELKDESLYWEKRALDIF